MGSWCRYIISTNSKTISRKIWNDSSKKSWTHYCFGASWALRWHRWLVTILFTDVELCKLLTSNGMFLALQIKRNKRFAPELFKDHEKSKTDEPKFIFRKKSTMVSYTSGSKRLSYFCQVCTMTQTWWHQVLGSHSLKFLQCY